ncbi:S-layer homology domain-containing protein [Paenibacillus sp. P26]|nr:S-layer homology domain-containing protein [Paenibacillus sp. P26]
MKKTLILGTILLLTSACDAVPNTIAGAEQAASVEFTDVSGHWAKDAVRNAVVKGYVDGYPDGSFKPDNSVSRAEFITMLSKALNEKVEVSNGEWYQPYVNAVVANGVHRYEDFTQDINGPITRQEMARLVVRATDGKTREKDAIMSDAPLFIMRRSMV